MEGLRLSSDLSGERISWVGRLFHLIREKSITEIKPEKNQTLHKAEFAEFHCASISETNSFDKKRPRQFSE